MSSLSDDSYDELPFWSAPFGLMLLDTIRVRRGIRVLDIGSGHGFPLLEIADRIRPEGEITGLEPQEEAIRIIHAKIFRREIPNATVIQGVAEKMPFHDGQFDLITSNNGLNNVQDQEASFRECCRVARPGAQMVITMNLPHTMIEFYEIMEKILIEKEMTPEVDLMNKHISSKRKSVEFLKELIISSGFSINSINIDGFKYRFTNGEAFFRHYTIYNYFLPSWKEILPKSQEDEILNLIKDRITDLCREKREFILSIPFACFDCYK